MIRAVIFDVGGVVCRLDEAAFAAEWSPKLGRGLQQIYDAMYGGSDETALVGKVGSEEWWPVVGERLAFDTRGLEAFRASYSSHWRWDPSILEFLQGLRPAYRTAFLTNAWSEVRSTFERAGVLGSVDDVIISAEVGCAKPGEQIYRLTLERVSAEPHEAIFVDDSEPNVVAARSLGLHGVLFRDPVSAIAEVRSLLG